MDIVEDDAGLRRTRLPDDVAEDDTSLGGRDLDRGLDAVEGVWAECVGAQALDELEVAQGHELDAQVLESVGCLIDDQYI